MLNRILCDDDLCVIGLNVQVSNHLVNDRKITFKNKVGDLEVTGSMEAEGNELTLVSIEMHLWRKERMNE